MAESAQSRLMRYWVTEMERQFSGRRVSLDFKDRENWNARELKQGVFSVIYQGETPTNDDAWISMNLMVVAQIELAERATGSEVQSAELALLADLRKFIASPQGAEWHLKSVSTSQQMEVPYGWVLANFTVGPVCIDEEPLAETAADILIGFAPDIGIDHVDDYIPLEDFILGT